MFNDKITYISAKGSVYVILTDTNYIPRRESV